MIIIDNDIPDSWTHVKQYRYDGKNNQDSTEFVTFKLNDLYAPNWMLSDDFLYSVLMKKDKALKLLNAKLNEII
jgi:hypothetical protein